MPPKKRPFKRIRKRLETALARAGCRLLVHLPRGAVVRMARALGAAGMLFAGRLRDVGMANLDLVFGDRLSAAEKRRILRRSAQGLALTALDSIWFSRDTVARVRRWVCSERRAADVFGEKSAICVTGHLGTWELLGHFLSVEGFPVSSVATPLKNAAVDELLCRARETVGQIIIPREGAVRTLLQTLRNGGRIALLLDQNTMLTEGGIFVDFFGVPATISPAGASLAIRTGTDLVFGFCLPRPDGSYRIEETRILHPPPYRRETIDEDVRTLTAQIAAVYEEVILAHPECWLWLYKRWKHIRPGDTRTGYPFYSSDLSERLIPASYRKGSA